MRIIIIGRTKILLDSAKLLQQNGHQIVGVITSKAAPEYQVNENDFSSYANELNIPFLHDPKINLKSLQNYFGNAVPDIAISMNYSGIISNSVVDFFPQGILNAHGGDLPRYRGNACQAWAIINGEDRIGLCVHKMIGDELDSGNIISRSYYTLDENKRIGEIYDFFNIEIPKLFLEALNQLTVNKSYYIEKQSRSFEEALRCFPRLPSDGEIKWTDDNLSILRLINASSEPYSGAFTTFKDIKLLIWRARLSHDPEKWVGVPGQICNFTENGDVVVLTGEGKIILEEISYKGYRGSPSKIINSLRSRLV